jgi:DNA replication protein DnaC
MTAPPLHHDTLKKQAQSLALHGVLAHWEDLNEDDLHRLHTWLHWETEVRQRRSLERRLANARLGQFKSLADFDWAWPKHIDKGAVSALMQLSFVPEASNVVLVGPNGVGKSTLAKNLAYQAILQGYTVRFTSASHMLNDLAAQPSDNALRRRLKHYTHPDLLAIDEVGYLSYSDRHADLLFEIISRRYEQKSTLVTTNRPFAEWGAVFPNAPCVVSLVDRLVHHAEIIVIEGDSYRMKEAKERAAKRQGETPKRSGVKSKPTNTEATEARV